MAKAKKKSDFSPASELIPPRASVPELAKAAAGCKACDLWNSGTQTVFGQGEGPHPKHVPPSLRCAIGSLAIFSLAGIQGTLQHIYWLLAHLGGFGILILSFVDSSPLFLPFGNDLLLVALTAHKRRLLVYYALMASAGSVLGALIVDALSRKGGEKGLERFMSRRRLEYIKRRVKKNAAWALAFACLMPPPFPFTGFVAATAAFQYPRKRLLLTVFFSRLGRFMIEGALATAFSHKLLSLAHSVALDVVVAVLIVFSIGASAIVIRGWFKRSKRASKSERRAPQPRPT